MERNSKTAPGTRGFGLDDVEMKDVLLPKELQEQVSAITKSARIADGIKKVIMTISRELHALRLENVSLKKELDNVRETHCEKCRRELPSNDSSLLKLKDSDL
ncbi:hypothetical protein GCK32_001881 [Trichostrongylus colubriformis]|uniref:Uncharacterized protein n=1 Tax=Trichostrongylus colubriformis TaxID=6319 RepID=A0AAN8FVT3_TRICO